MAQRSHVLGEASVRLELDGALQNSHSLLLLPHLSMHCAQGIQVLHILHQDMRYFTPLRQISHICDSR